MPILGWQEALLDCIVNYNNIKKETNEQESFNVD